MPNYNAPIPEAMDANFLCVEKQYLNHNDLYKFREDLVIASLYDPEKTVKLYKEDNRFFYFPRYYFKSRFQVFRNIIDNTSLGRPLSFTCSTTLWDYQQKAVNEFQGHVNKGVTGFFLNAAPGAGKTQMGIEMIRVLARRAMIVVPKKDLLHQWVERILKTTDIKEDRIGICQSGTIDWREKKIVIGLVHTLVKHQKDLAFAEAFGTVVFDECDSSVPPRTFAPVSVMFKAKYRIGMTASEIRSDGLDVVFRLNITEVKIKCEKSNTLDPMVIVCNYNYSSGELPYTSSRIAMKGMFLSLIADNEHRNNFIADQGAVAYGEGRYTAIMSDRLSQLNKIYELLVYHYNIPKRAIGYYIGENKKQENKRVADNCKLILATYGMMSRGTDIQRLSTLILATPRNEMIQVAGRIERALPGKPTPIILDIVDNDYAMAKQGLQKRLEYYFGRNLKVLEKTCP